MDKERAGIQSVEVGFLLLEGLTRSRGPLMLKDLAASAGMSAAKAHRYLVSFQRLGLVVQDSRTAHYDLGPAALKLGLASLSRLDAVRLARERMPALMQTIGHTLALAVWGNRGPTIVHWEESSQAVTANLRLGDVMPLLSSATGRCFAAHMPREAVAPMLQDELAHAAKLRRTDLPTTAAAVARMWSPSPTRIRGSAIAIASRPKRCGAPRTKPRYAATSAATRVSGVARAGTPASAAPSAASTWPSVRVTSSATSASFDST